MINTRLLFNDNESKTSQIFANRKFVLYCREVVYVRPVVSLMVDKKRQTFSADLIGLPQLEG